LAEEFASGDFGRGNAKFTPSRFIWIILHERKLSAHSSRRVEMAINSHEVKNKERKEALERLLPQQQADYGIKTKFLLWSTDHESSHTHDAIRHEWPGRELRGLSISSGVGSRHE